jgi:hypothetical protein
MVEVLIIAFPCSFFGFSEPEVRVRLALVGHGFSRAVQLETLVGFSP